MEPEDYADSLASGDARKRKWNFWGYIDARDAAQAFVWHLRRKSKVRKCSSSQMADSVMERDNHGLLKEVFPMSPQAVIWSNETLLAIDKARSVLVTNRT